MSYGLTDWDKSYTMSECLSAARAFQRDSFRLQGMADASTDNARRHWLCEYANQYARNADYWYGMARVAKWVQAVPHTCRAFVRHTDYIPEAQS